MNEAKTRTNFSFDLNGDPISNHFNGFSATVSGGNASIILGTPNDLDNIESGSGVTVTPSNAKYAWYRKAFSTSDKKYGLVYMKDMRNFATYCYVDRDVTIKGSYTDSGSTEKYDLNLKRGWNYVFLSSNSDETLISYSSSIPSGSRWVVASIEN
jgi:hypothetical protein